MAKIRYFNVTEIDAARRGSTNHDTGRLWRRLGSARMADTKFGSLMQQQPVALGVTTDSKQLLLCPRGTAHGSRITGGRKRTEHRTVFWRHFHGSQVSAHAWSPTPAWPRRFRRTRQKLKGHTALVSSSSRGRLRSCWGGCSWATPRCFTIASVEIFGIFLIVGRAFCIGGSFFTPAAGAAVPDAADGLLATGNGHDLRPDIPPRRPSSTRC